MVLRSKRDYLEAISSRYARAGKKGKTLILDEFCANCGYNRKYAFRLLRKPHRKQSGKNGNRPGPKVMYHEAKLIEALKHIWFATDQTCSKKLKAALPLWLPFYGREFEALEKASREKLLRASTATIDWLLKPYRAFSRKGRCTTRPGTLLKNQIPIKTDRWDVSQPGFFEADTVAHCGNSMDGDFVYSLTFSDILSGWTENKAVWGRGSQGVLKRIEDIEEGLVFPILGFDGDNAPNSSTITCSGISRTAPKYRSSSPGHVPTVKTSTLLLNRNTGTMSVNSWAMKGLKSRSRSSSSTTSTRMNGASSPTTSAQPSNSKRKRRLTHDT
jgi:hypothetical protein